MAGTAGTKEIATRSPVTSGLDADQKHEGRQINLVPIDSSLVLKRKSEGL